MARGKNFQEPYIPIQSYPVPKLSKKLVIRKQTQILKLIASNNFMFSSLSLSLSHTHTHTHLYNINNLISLSHTHTYSKLQLWDRILKMQSEINYELTHQKDTLFSRRRSIAASNSQGRFVAAKTKTRSSVFVKPSICNLIQAINF